MNILKTIGLKKIYKTPSGEVRALDGVSVSIEDGEFVSVAGPSGCGKTTLLNMLGGLDDPTEGKVMVRGEEISRLKKDELTVFRRRNIGFVFQNYNLVPVLNVYENILLPLRLDGRTADHKFLDRIIHTLKLQDRLDHMPHMLSGGQQQRVAIARALALQPDILCFDEPTSALDPELTGEVLKVIRGLAKQRTTMIIVTHEMAFARDVADRIIFMDEGVIVEQGDPRQVIDHPREERTKQFLTKY